MDNIKKISICIATYNRSEKLKKVVELLENQTMNKSYYEIIITDSYSTDGTKKVINELQNKYDNIIYKEDSKNVLAAKRNDGIKISNSDIIVFLDDDVFPRNDFVKAHYEANINNNDTFYCGQIRFDSDLVLKSNYYRFRDDQHLKDDSIDIDLPFNKIVVMNLSFRKSFIDEVGFVDERFVNYGSEDTEFGYRVVKKGYKLKYLNNAYAIHNESSSDIIEYSKKIALNSLYGKTVLNNINPNVLKELKQSRFDDINFINSFIFNNLFKKIIETYLIYTDKLKIFYSYILFKFYFYCVNYYTIKNNR